MFRLICPIRRSLAGLAVLAAAPAFAASPALDYILPRGVQQGSEVEVTFRGQRLADAQDVFFYQPGITVSDFKVQDERTVKCKFKVAPDAPYGEYQARLRTATGISELRNFYVGVYPNVNETAEPGITSRKRDPKDGPIPPEKLPSTFEKPQPIPQNVTVEGVLEREQSDYYQIEGKAGDRLNIETEGVRLGKIFDTRVTVYAADRKQLAMNDDNAFSREDACLGVTLPADGKYILEIRESTYLGDNDGYYRMHVGSFPRPRAVFPAGGKAGQELKLKFIGDVGGDFEQTVTVPNTPGQVWPLLAEQNGLKAPTPNPFRVVDFDSVREESNNDTTATATPYDGKLPVGFDGVIETPGDVDYYRFTATAGQAYEVQVYARRVRSPLDPVVTIFDEKGMGLSSDDDAGGQGDSLQRFTPPKDGQYFVGVRSHLKRGGPDFVYRVEIVQPSPSLVLSIPNANVNPTQERQVVAVPRGGRFGTTLLANRNNVEGTLKLVADGLPPGVTMSAAPLVAGQNAFVVLFEAAADAPLGGNLVSLSTEMPDKENQRAGSFVQPVVLAWQNNRPPYYTSTAGKLAVAVCEPPPYTLTAVQSKNPVVQNGTYELKVKAERHNGFAGAINIRCLSDPPGVGMGALQLKPDQAEGTLTINAQGNAKLGPYQTTLLSSTDVGGTQWISSNFFSVDVAAPYLAAQIERQSVPQGGSVQIKVKLDQKLPFEGKAKLQLLGLPNEATAGELEITKDDKEAVFEVKTTSNTPVATHKGLLCRAYVMKEGEPIVHNLGQGGVLRVDPAPTPAPAEKPVAAKQ